MARSPCIEELHTAIGKGFLAYDYIGGHFSKCNESNNFVSYGVFLGGKWLKC